MTFDKMFDNNRTDHDAFVPCTDQNEINTFINDIVQYLQADERVHAYAYSNGLGLGDVWPLMNGHSLRSPFLISFLFLESHSDTALLGRLILLLSASIIECRVFFFFWLILFEQILVVVCFPRELFRDGKPFIDVHISSA